MADYSLKRIKEICQLVLNFTFLVAVVLGLIAVTLLHVGVISSARDTRCRCVCPHNINKTRTSNATVFVTHVTDAAACHCLEVFSEADKAIDPELCLRCTCTFETRDNLLIITVIVLVIVAVWGLLIATVVKGVLMCVAARDRRSNYEQLDSHRNIHVSTSSFSEYPDSVQTQ